MSYSWIVLFSSAITVVFVRGEIFHAVRSHGPDLWRQLTTCALCSGVWIGGGVTWLASLRDGFQTVFPLLFIAIALGSLTGVTALVYVRVIDWLESAAVELESRDALNQAESKALLREQGEVAEGRRD